MNAKIKIDENIVTVKPLLIFLRIFLNLTANKKMSDYLKFELAPYPLSIFDETGMRKTSKSSFICPQNFECIDDFAIEEPAINVVDGGFFIHQKSWSTKASLDDILNAYVKYAVANYKPNSVIVFDGYSVQGTKNFERTRRKNSTVGREINLRKNVIVPLRS